LAQAIKQTLSLEVSIIKIILYMGIQSFFSKTILLALFPTLMGMAKFINLDIKAKFPLYTSLIKDKKYISDRTILVSTPKPNQRHFLLNQNVLKHSILENLVHPITFLTEVKRVNHKHFLFNLRCVDLTLKPFFGYHSGGAAHRNYDDNIPFSDQFIDTPHFNCYTEEGLSIAYKTDKLLNKSESVALEDISLCAIYFCQEANIYLSEDGFPQFEVKEFDLFENLDEENPDKYVMFK
jgi:hypothetical protein